MGDRLDVFDKIDEDHLKEMESALRRAANYQIAEYWTHVGSTVMRDRDSAKLARSEEPEIAEFIVRAVNSFRLLLANLRAARTEIAALKAGAEQSRLVHEAYMAGTESKIRAADALRAASAGAVEEFYMGGGGCDLAALAAAVGAYDEAPRKPAFEADVPIIDDFWSGVRAEKVHQLRRWGTTHDRNKSPADWYWLVGYLAGKALMSAMRGDTKKALHHCISSAAVLANWHDALGGGAPGQQVDNRLAKVAADARRRIEHLESELSGACADVERLHASITESVAQRDQARAEVERLTRELTEARANGEAELASLRRVYAAACEWGVTPSSESRDVTMQLVRATMRHTAEFGKPQEPAK